MMLFLHYLHYYTLVDIVINVYNLVSARFSVSYRVQFSDKFSYSLVYPLMLSYIALHVYSCNGVKVLNLVDVVC